MSKEISIVDVDDVLTLSAQGYTDISNARWGTQLSVEDYTEQWTDWWQCTTEECAVRNDIIWREGLPGSFDPVPGAAEGLHALAERGPVRILTARPMVARKVTEESLVRNFGDIFDEIVFAGIFDNGATAASYKLTKGEMVRKLGGDRIVDEQPKHVNGSAEMGIADPILFGDYHWQRYVRLHRRVVRGFDWGVIINHVRAAA